VAKASLPRLTEAQVRKLASAQSFERGVDYYYGSAIFDTVREGMKCARRPGLNWNARGRSAS
jgi:hypothetical protein